MYGLFEKHLNHSLQLIPTISCISCDDYLFCMNFATFKIGGGEWRVADLDKYCNSRESFSLFILQHNLSYMYIIFRQC